jgi:hypothetical protein
VCEKLRWFEDDPKHPYTSLKYKLDLTDAHLIREIHFADPELIPRILSVKFYNNSTLVKKMSRDEWLSYKCGEGFGGTEIPLLTGPDGTRHGWNCVLRGYIYHHQCTIHIMISGIVKDTPQLLCYGDFHSLPKPLEFQDACSPIQWCSRYKENVCEACLIRHQHQDELDKESD